MLELAHIDFKTAILNICKYLNEKMETTIETYDQYENLCVLQART